MSNTAKIGKNIMSNFDFLKDWKRQLAYLILSEFATHKFFNVLRFIDSYR
jgi:hypothetical protein